MLPFEPFNPLAPELGNQYHDDPVLRTYLRRALPPGGGAPPVETRGRGLT